MTSEPASSRLLDQDRRTPAGVRAAWIAAVSGRDAEALRELIAPDYEVWANAAPSLAGPDAVISAMRVAMQRYDIEQSFESIDTVLAGDWAFERGIEQLKITPVGGGPTQTMRQRALLILRRGSDGQWQYARGMTNALPTEEPSGALNAQVRDLSIAAVDAGRVDDGSSVFESSTLPTGIHIRAYEPVDNAEWLRMRRALWPEIPRDEEADDAAAWLARSDTIVLVAARPDATRLAGFAELGARDYADGCDTSPVAYLEGWYVDAAVRRQGIGAALVRAGEAWARRHGYRELASDALLDNATSHRAHLALGFSEVERAIRYRKVL